MANLNQLSEELAKTIATELQKSLKSALVFEHDRDLKNSIQITKVNGDYVIKMREYWSQVEYLTNPFIRFTLNTKMDDILKKVTTQMSR